MAFDRPDVPRPKVFISYAHEQDIDGHRERALELAQSLRLRGVEANIDQFLEHDPPLWPRWMSDEIRDSDFVLCLASPLYKQRVEMRGDATSGRGVRWEGSVITEELYAQSTAAQSRFIAVLLKDCSSQDIPDVLLPVGRSFYEWPRDDENLYRRLTKQPRVVPEPLGEIVRLETLSPRHRRTKGTEVDNSTSDEHMSKPVS